MSITTENVPARVDARFRGGMSASVTVDVRALRRRLEETVRGEVRFDAGSKALYATDASNYRQVPLGVVIPKTLDDIVATHRACHEFGAPVLPRGGGTSLSGETVNFAVVIDVSKYLTQIGDADAHSGTVICEPGVINEKLNEKTGEQINMIFGPDPSTHSRCTIGGNIGNNSCGIHSVQSQLYGPGPRTSDSGRRSRSSPTTESASGSESTRRTSSRRSSPRAGAKGRSTPRCGICGIATES